MAGANGVVLKNVVSGHVAIGIPAKNYYREMSAFWGGGMEINDY